MSCIKNPKNITKKILITSSWILKKKKKIKPWCQQEFADLWEKNNRKLKNQQELTQHQLVFLDLHDLYGWLFGKKNKHEQEYYSFENEEKSIIYSWYDVQNSLNMYVWLMK